MGLVTVEDGTSRHTGSVCSPVVGSLLVTHNAFVKIDGVKIMVETDTMEIPSHLDPSCITTHGPHSYPIDTFAQDYVTVEGKRIVLLGDSYSPDPTNIINQGSNTFVTIS